MNPALANAAALDACDPDKRQRGRRTSVSMALMAGQPTPLTAVYFALAARPCSSQWRSSFSGARSFSLWGSPWGRFVRWGPSGPATTRRGNPLACGRPFDPQSADAPYVAGAASNGVRVVTHEGKDQVARDAGFAARPAVSQSRPAARGWLVRLIGPYGVSLWGSRARSPRSGGGGGQPDPRLERARRRGACSTGPANRNDRTQAPAASINCWRLAAVLDDRRRLRGSASPPCAGSSSWAAASMHHPPVLVQDQTG